MTGNPTLPRWLGNVMFSMVLSEKSENDKCAKQLRSSAGVAVFVGERAAPAHWLEVGHGYERFSLAATVLGVLTACVNQPVEVPAVRTQFAQWLGLGAARPGLGRALRSRTAATVLITTAGCRCGRVTRCAQWQRTCETDAAP